MRNDFDKTFDFWLTFVTILIFGIFAMVITEAIDYEISKLYSSGEQYSIEELLK